MTTSFDSYASVAELYDHVTPYRTRPDVAFFVEEAVKLHKDKITTELIAEMEGIAAGYSKAGVPTTLDDIIGWNAYMEITGYWWPTVASQYVNSAPTGNRKSHCSAFIATGSAKSSNALASAPLPSR